MTGIWPKGHRLLRSSSLVMESALDIRKPADTLLRLEALTAD